MKRMLILVVLILLVGLTGCTTIPVKLHQPLLTETDKVFINDVRVFTPLKRNFFTGAIEDWGTFVPVSEKRYSDLIQGYLTVLKKELEKKGFIIVSEPGSEIFVLKTRIGDEPSTKGVLGYTLVGQGTVAVEVSVYQNNNLVLTFVESAPYSIFSIETQIKRLTPRIAQKIRQNLQ